MRNNVYLTVSSLLVLASGILIPISFAKWATQESYGQFSYLISLMGLLSLFCLPGMNDAIIQGTARGERGIWLAALKTRLSWCCIGIVVLFAIGVWSTVKKHPLGHVLLFMAPFLLVYVLDSTKAFLTGQMAYRIVSWINVGAQGIPVFTVILLLRLGHEEILWTGVGYFGALFAFYASIFLATLPRKSPRGEFSQKTLHYGKHMSFLSSFGVFQTYIDKVIVGSLMGFTNLALYSVAAIFQTPVKHLSWGVFYPLLLPRYAQATAEDLRKGIRRSLKRVAIVSILGVLPALFFIHPFVEWTFGEPYKRIAPYAFLFIVGGFCLIPGMIFDLALRSKQMNTEIYILRVGQAFITIVSLFLLIPIFSLLGAVLADLISNILYSFLGFFLHLRIWKKVEVRREDLYDLAPLHLEREEMEESPVF